MQNSFEKQVKEKLDELKFVPTPPVWHNIEKQIRIKKDRRRLFIWLPLFVLFLGGGTWWALNGIQKKKSLTIAGQKNMAENQRSSAVEQEGQHNIKMGEKDKSAQAEIIPYTKENRSSQKEQTSFTTQLSHPKISKRKLAADILSKVNDWIFKEAVTPQDLSSGMEQNSEVDKAANTNRSIVPEQNISTNLYESSRIKDGTVQLNVADTKQDKVDSVIPATEKKTRTIHSKWQLGFMANGGIAGISKGLNVFSADKAMLDAYSNATGAFNPRPRSSAPSPIENGLSFAIGVLAKRQLNNRVSFTTGLEYQYYSNQMAVGQMRRQDTAIAQSAGRIINQFYLNSGSDFKDYRNQFHFIALPVLFDWRMLRKAPLHLQAGFSLQQLISTNALIYDQGSGIYYSDNSAFNKTQLFSRLGFSYTVLDNKKTSFSLGPHLQYGLTKVEKNNSGYHLFSLGLSAQFLFQKK